MTSTQVDLRYQDLIDEARARASFPGVFEDNTPWDDDFDDEEWTE